MASRRHASTASAVRSRNWATDCVGRLNIEIEVANAQLFASPFSDAIGRKIGNVDKCCMIKAHRDGREPIAVTHRESTMGQAIHGAIHNLKKSVVSALGKESTRDHLRDHY